MTEEASDQDLAARAAAGERAAYDLLVRRYKEPLYRFIRRYAGDADDAYDLLQESFIAAWTALHRYDPGRPFRPWLYRIALNKCRDFGRRKSVRAAVLRILALTSADAAPPAGADEDDEAQTSERLARLDKAIASLPALYKEPLLLTVIEGMSQEEAAAILKTTRKAIEMRLYRARRRLSEITGDPEEGD